jgi:5-methylcytosine-specific restriction endonuclease McrA
MSKYRISANLVWDVESDSDFKTVREIAQQQLKEVLANSSLASKLSFKSHVGLNKLRDKPKFWIIGEFKPEEVLPFVTMSETRKEYTIDGKTYMVRMNSHRYFTFARSLACASCGIKGSKMILETHNSIHPHFNLYAEEDGNLVLMTKDHIKPRCNGGESNYANYQTLCCICNGIKGSHDISLSDLNKLRQIYKENKKLSSKKLYALIEEAKKTLLEAKVSLQ